jgi:hypothetical protein
MRPPASRRRYDEGFQFHRLELELERHKNWKPVVFE